MIAGGIRLGMLEDRLARINRDAEEVESVIEMVHELRQVNPVLTPILDLRRSAQSLRLAANKLENMAEQAELVP